MEMDKFVEKIREKLWGTIEGITEIKATTVLKNNGVALHGLVFVDERSNITPTVYLDNYYKMYRTGSHIDYLVKRIVDEYKRGRLQEQVDFSFFRDWEQVKSMVAFKLINKEWNRELLECVPYKEVLDLAMVFYVALPDMSGSILIYNNHMDMWGVDVEELAQVAEENTPRICPMCLLNLKKVMEEMTGEEITEDMQMHILTNQAKCMGAGVMLYPAVMEVVADMLQSDVYILPASIHETLLLPVSNGDEPEMFLEMVKSVNGTAVEPEEVLSESVYIYRRKENKISMIE